MIGIAPFFSVILHLTTKSSSILSKLPLSSFRRESPTHKQAVPLFPDKLFLLSNHLVKRLAWPNLSATEQFITARDQAFFETLFYSGDRAGDLEQVKTAEISRFTDDSGFPLNHVWGKTLRDGSSNLFGFGDGTPTPLFVQ